MCSNLSMNLAHKIALNPTRSQERLLWEHVGYARFAANSALADFREGLAAREWRERQGRFAHAGNARKAEIAPWAAHLSQNASKNAIRNVGKAISRWGDYRRALREKEDLHDTSAFPAGASAAFTTATRRIMAGAPWRCADGASDFHG